MKKFLLLSMLALAMFVVGCSDDDDKSPLAPTPAGDSYVRVVHLSPDAPAVDVWVDGSRVLQNVAFSQASSYLTVPSGNHQVQVTPAGVSQPVVLEANVDLSQNVAYTVAATGLLANLQAVVLSDDHVTNSEQAKVRFVHAAPDAPEVDVVISGGATLFSNVAFRESGAYLTVPASQYVLDVLLSGSSTVALRAHSIAAGANANYTIFATGLAGDGSLAAMVLVDAGTPMAIPSSELRVAHLSPDAPAVDVWVNGTRVLENVPFQAVSGYLTVTSGQHWVQVTPTGATEPVVIDAVITAAANTSYTVAATGLLSGNDLSPMLLIDDRTPIASQAKVRFVHTSPDAPAVDIAVAGGPVLFSGVAFREIGNYLTVAPQSYDLEVRLAGTDTVVLPLAGVALAPSENYSVFAIGLVGSGTLRPFVVEQRRPARIE